jgi:hypothetical protein
MSEPTEDPILLPVKELITIFEEHLTSVAFPDVSLNILQSLVEQVRTNALELDEINARLLTVRETLENSQQELLQKCLRGLAYAKVYAEDREDLYEKLSQISLGKPSRAPKKASVKADESVSDEKSEKKVSAKSAKRTEVQNSEEPISAQ